MLSDRLLSRKRRRRTWFAASPRPLQSFARPSPVKESSRIASSPDLWFAVKLSPAGRSLPPIRFEKHLGGVIRGSPVYIHYYDPVSDEILANTLLDCPHSLRDRDGVIVRRDPN